MAYTSYLKYILERYAYDLKTPLLGIAFYQSYRL